MNEQDKIFIKEIVRETIKELKRSGMLKNVSDMAYSEATALLRSYYKKGENNKAVAKALKEIEHDTYYKIIPLYFRYGYTVEEISEVFDVEPSTITRNKKRLCLTIYEKIE